MFLCVLLMLLKLTCATQELETKSSSNTQAEAFSTGDAAAPVASIRAASAPSSFAEPAYLAQLQAIPEIKALGPIWKSSQVRHVPHRCVCDTPSVLLVEFH